MQYVIYGLVALPLLAIGSAVMFLLGLGAVLKGIDMVEAQEDDNA